jgi:amicoumacin kinase
MSLEEACGPTTVIDLAKAAAPFGITASELVPMTGGHVSAVYEFAREGRRYVLRMLPPSDEFCPSNVAAIQAWVAHLARHGAPVPSPLLTKTGEPFAVVACDAGSRIVVASEKARGVRAETLPQTAWTDAYFQNLGATAGHLHHIAVDYEPDPALRRPDILTTSDLFNGNPTADAAIHQRRQAVLAALRALPKHPTHFGMVHGDFHFGNFFVDLDRENAVTVFDFDDCGYCWYLLDTATLLFDVAVLYEGPDREGFGAHFLRHYLTGYRQVRTVEPFWLAHLPHFLKLLEISYYTLLAPLYEAGEGDEWINRFMSERAARINADLPYLQIDPVAAVATLN